MTKSTLNSGSVLLCLTGEDFASREHKLLPTLGAALNINDEFGGLLQAHTLCMKMDVRSIAAVLCHALNGSSEAGDFERDDVTEYVLRTGMQPCFEAARDYLDLVYRGGTQQKSAEGGKTTVDPQKPKKTTTGS